MIKRSHTVYKTLVFVLLITGFSCGIFAQNFRELTDMAGRTVKVPAEVKRIATNFPALNQMFLMLGAGDLLVAKDYYIQSVPWFVKLYPRIQSLPEAFSETGVNLETLAVTKPDLVFLSNASMAAQIEKLGIPSFVVFFKDFDTLKEGINLMGQILGEKALAKAQEYTHYLDKNLALVQKLGQSIPQAEQKKVYYCAGSILNTEGSESLPDLWIRLAGGRNVAAENGIKGSFKDIALEDLIRWNPDIIVCRDAAYKDQIQKDSRWQSIKAVQTKQVYINPQGVYCWAVRSAEEALQILWISSLMYPEKTKNINLLEETKYFYKTFHNYNLSTTEAYEMLKIDPKTKAYR